MNDIVLRVMTNDFLPLPHPEAKPSASRAGEGRGEGLRVAQVSVSRSPLIPTLSPRGEGEKP